jgi:Transglycosylase-like domain
VKESRRSTALALALSLLLVVLVALLVETARAVGALTPATIRYWDRIAACETHGNWGMRGSTYEGGLGFYVGTWRWWAGELGLLGRYPHAYMAPRLVQVRVADYGRRVHRGYWGCA